MTSDKWDRRFLELARTVASWSKDPSTQVGAVLVSPDRALVILGYNGFPRGVEDDPACLFDRDTKLAMTIHAEENAILVAQRNLQGFTLYVWPIPPCSTCAAKIVQVGISRVVAPLIVDAATEQRWAKSNQIGMRMFEQAGVTFSRVSV